MALGAWALAIAFATASGVFVDGHRVARGHNPAWSPDGRRIAFVQRGDLWLMDADGSHRDRIVRAADQPAWSPDGRRIAFVRGGAVWTIRADRANEHRLATGRDPDWSRDGERVAFERDGELYSVRWYGGDVRDHGPGTDPAWGTRGRLASTVDGQLAVNGTPVTALAAPAAAPSWSPGGVRIAFVTDDTLWTSAPDGSALRKLAPGYQPSWRPPVSGELLPDLDQRPPSALVIGGGPGRWLLGFTSSVDNVGLGPMQLEGFRSSGAARMQVRQRVFLESGGARVYRDAGKLRYTRSAPHFHWHYMRFVSFELHSLDGSVLVRDRKSGFCLADHYGTAPGVPRSRPVYLSSCGQFQPQATSVLQGTSVGYTDRYPGFFHGQNVAITGVPAGDYVLVHHANPNMFLHELRYENNAASVRIRLSWRTGRPSVQVLRTCPATDRC